MTLANITGQILDDKYRIEQELGKGGMGSVYYATHLGTGRPVALKVIAPQFMNQDEFVERFRREAKAAGRLRHPNVVDVTDFGFAHTPSGQVAYLVMEYLDGCTLAEVLAEESQLSLAWVIDILEQACSAVDEAHRQGIIHRDLKPDNIWLEPNRRGGYTVKVLDFGLAKLAEPTAPLVGEAMTANSDGENAEASSLPPLLRPDAQFISHPGSRTAATPSSDSPSAAAREEEQTRIFVQSTDPAVAGNENETRIQQATTLVEEQTRIQPPMAAEDSDTRLLTPPSQERDATRILNEPTQDLHPAQVTAPADGLTRVGSILGTPIYMSPEQCRGDALDTRSDIYSLGVIAYQMLCGVPPFKGEMMTLMRLHVEVAPPSLREKNSKISKRVERLVLASLAKDPAARPASAAGFAAALRASAEGTGALVRRALMFYAERFPKFFKVSILTHAPILLLQFVGITLEVFKAKEVFSPLTMNILTGSLGLVAFFVNFFAASILAGMTIRMVTQLMLTPLRPIQLRSIYAALKKRFWPLVKTSMMVSFVCFLGLILCVIPGVILFVNYALYAPVLMMENLKGRAAMRRSKELTRRSRLTVLGTIVVQWSLPLLTSITVGVILGLTTKLSGIPYAKEITASGGQLVSVTFNILFTPLIAALNALLYFKMRNLGGETLTEVLNQLDEEETPRSQWQQRIRERSQSRTSFGTRISDTRRTPAQSNL